jgi:hypothetical protein
MEELALRAEGFFLLDLCATAKAGTRLFAFGSS